MGCFGEGSRRLRGKFAVTGFGEGALGRSDNVGKQDGRGECDDRNKHKDHGVKSTDIAEGMVGALSWVGGSWRRSRMFVAIVGFTNPGGASYYERPSPSILRCQAVL